MSTAQPKTLKQNLFRSLRLSLKDAASYSIMVGTGESYLAAYLLALGYSAAAAGLITTVPVVVGSAIQLSFIWVYRQIRSYRNWVIVCARAQALSLLVLAALPYVFPNKLGPIYFAASIYWACSFSAGPAWNAWMGALVPTRLRVQFFAQRTRQAGIFTYIGLFGAGIFLHLTDRFHVSQYCFTFLFIIAACARLLSAYFISQQIERPKEKVEKVISNNFSFLSELKDPKLIAILFYLFILQTAVFISAPYYTPFMLKDLNLSYASFMILSSTTFLSRIIFYPQIQKVADRFGPLRMLWTATIFISIVPVMWTISKNYFFLMCLQVVSGLAWGMQELGMFLLILDRFPTHTRSHVLSMVNFLSSIGMLIGSFVGSRIITEYSAVTSTYYLIFTFSTLGRSLCVFALPYLDEVPRSRRFHLLWRILGFRPNLGFIARPILYIGRRTVRSSEKSKHSATPHDAGKTPRNTTEKT